MIRGNISEIKTLAVGTGTTKGVDADIADRVTEDNLDEAVAFVKKFAERTGAVIAVTGAIDLVADAKKCVLHLQWPSDDVLHHGNRLPAFCSYSSICDCESGSSA